MSAEDVVAPPNWLRELEEKREMKLKARLGHEAGAGSPCLECKEKCPGLDLHFWRKICKICKCGKENHGIYDDDVNGWIQFQLLGSKPKRTPHKIKLSGPNELELDWTPKGSKEAVEKYLKDLPPEQLPIKGSTAAKERKQLLQKQIPFHDVDPTLCHALTEEETKRMNDYVTHLKDTSVGIGHLLNYQSPISAKLVVQKCPIIKHDYENIDAFGNHKLAASLEELQRQQRELKFQEATRGQFAMLLDKNGTPLKDPMGKPIKATLDLFGKVIFDQVVSDKISPLAKAEFAMLLDKNGAPILNVDGNPIKQSIEHQKSVVLHDKFGNEIKPFLALLLDTNLSPCKDKFGSPIKVKLDTSSKPILDKSLAEVFQDGEIFSAPKYFCYLDKNGAPILGSDGKPLTKSLFDKQTTPKFAIFLNGNKEVIRDKCGDPITSYLDHFGSPIIGQSTIEELNNVVPSYCVLLDDKGDILETQNFNAHKEVIVDKFDNELHPQYGLLLDEYECPMKDGTGSPIKVPLDKFLRPKFDSGIVEKLKFKHPEYVMFLDRNGGPILDKYGSPIKNIAYSTPESNFAPPKWAVLLDKNEQPLTGIKTQVDLLHRPLDKSLQKEAKYAMPLDNSGIFPITYLQSPKITSNFRGSQPKPQWISLSNYPDNKFLEEITGAKLISPSSGLPILDTEGIPIEIKLDHYGYPIMQNTNCDIQGATLLGLKGLPLIDKNTGQILKIKVDRNGAIIDGIGLPVYLEPSISKLVELPPVVDKYGNVIDPRTGRPLDSILPNFSASLTITNSEDIQEPSKINIGMITDIQRSFQNDNVSTGQNSTRAFLDAKSFDIPTCHRCKRIIEDNAVVVQIERTEALWHTNCFTCLGCNQPLVDLFYCYHADSDDVYCGRDYAKMRGIPRCNACDELIFVKEYCLTEDTTYHIKHFCCFECDTPLAGKDYLMENNQPVCIGCYERVKADLCLACGAIIRPNEQGAVLNGDHFHATNECFACRTCRKPLLGGKFLYRGKQLFCSGVCFNSKLI